MSGLEAIGGLAVIAAVWYCGGWIVEKFHRCSFGQNDNCQVCNKPRTY